MDVYSMDVWGVLVTVIKQLQGYLMHHIKQKPQVMPASASVVDELGINIL